MQREGGDDADAVERSTPVPSPQVQRPPCQPDVHNLGYRDLQNEKKKTKARQPNENERETEENSERQRKRGCQSSKVAPCW